MGSIGAPVIEWIRAIENPGGDNSAGLARLKDWERQTDSGVTIAVAIPFAWMTFGAWDEIAKDASMHVYMPWHPDAGEFRKTDVYKDVVRESGVFAYWQARGYPPQCKPVGDDDFECTPTDTPRRSTRNLVN